MRRNIAALALVAVILAPAVAGCAAVAPEPKPTPHVRFAPVAFSGTLSGQDDIRVPAAAHSATITVVCSGSESYSLDGALNPRVSGLNGTCNGGTHRYEMPVEPLRTLHFELDLDTVGSFVVETRFSVNRLVADTELAGQCGAMVTVASSAFNAEDGYTRGAVTRAQWQTRIDTASRALAPLRGDKRNILSAPLKTISDLLTSRTAAPGSFQQGDYELAMSEIRQVCSDSGDATYITAEFGG